MQMVISPKLSKNNNNESYPRKIKLYIENYSNKNI